MGCTAGNGREGLTTHQPNSVCKRFSTRWLWSRPHPGLCRCTRVCLGVWGVRPPSEGTAAASELSVGLEGLERDGLLPGKGANVGCHTGRAWGAWVSPPLVAARRDDLATTPPLAGLSSPGRAQRWSSLSSPQQSVLRHKSDFFLACHRGHLGLERSCSSRAGGAAVRKGIA